MSRPLRTSGARLACAAIVIAQATACQPKPAPAPTPSSVDARLAPTPWPETELAALPAELNSPRAAAMALATMEPPGDVRARMEIALHAALYRFAQDEAGDAKRGFLLLPAQDDSAEAPSGAAAMTSRELQLRVLAAMDGGEAPVAWASAPPRPQAPERFPGTALPAVRLHLRIIERHEADATVVAEIGQSSSGEPSSLQRVMATWDGAAWNVRRAGVRVTW
jgi:hypothetical protein